MADEEHVKELLKGVESWNAWREANPDVKPDLRGFSFSKVSVPGHLIEMDVKKRYETVHLNEINLAGVNLIDADLRDISMFKANLQGSHFLYSNLEGTYLAFADLKHASINSTRLKKADLYNADLRKSNAIYADLREANLQAANLAGAFLDRANLQGAHLLETDLSYTTLTAVNLNDANVTGVKFSRDTLQRNFKGIRVATSCGSQAFKSFAQDQDFIEELRNSGWRDRLKFWLRYIFADCGRSFSRWAAWSLGLATLFGYLYYWMGPHHFQVDRLPFELSSMIYYSVVTFTTLGFGDIKPATIEGSFWVMIEVIIGYIMLGGLISILANKLARRA